MNDDKVPICVDLDGTLIYSDMLYESALILLKVNLLYFLMLPFIFIYGGKAKLKKWIAQRISYDPAILPYNHELINWLLEKHSLGYSLVLCTASDRSIAEPIAKHLGFFDLVMASDGVLNLNGRIKAAALVDKFGNKKFDYVGNSISDLQVWPYSRNVIVVNASNSLMKVISSRHVIDKIFVVENSKKISFYKGLRIHQWLKNILLFVPLLAAHYLFDVDSWISLFWSFLSFSLCASSVYVANDLLDLESDRQHPRKCKRPFASGEVPLWKGVVLIPLLFILSFMLGLHVGIDFFQWLLFYFFLTCVYSIKLKQLVLIDCMTLTILYSLRIVAGAAAIGSALSFWLLAFSVFLFLSLAFIKRYAELQVQILNGKHKAHGRGYVTNDSPLIQTLGITSGFMSVLVLALYLNSPEVLRLYAQPEWLWGNIPVMVFWVSWLWLRAHRGEMHDDPLIFAVKDKVSLLAGAFFVFFMLMGAMHL